MRGKFPIGIYYLNGFLQASIISMGSYRHLCCIYSRLRLVPFASLRGRIYFFNVIFFYFPQCRHGLAASSQTVSVGHERNEQPKGKPRTSWRLLRRLIGENR